MPSRAPNPYAPPASTEDNRLGPFVGPDKERSCVVVPFIRNDSVRWLFRLLGLVAMAGLYASVRYIAAVGIDAGRAFVIAPVSAVLVALLIVSHTTRRRVFLVRLPEDAPGVLHVESDSRARWLRIFGVLFLLALVVGTTTEIVLRE